MHSKICWICEASADSMEHKIKKSDIEKLFGKGAYKGENEICMIQKESSIPILGANSKKLKYDKVICEKCNNATTQPFDKAYEVFINYVSDNDDDIIHKRYIDFEKIYQKDFMKSQLNLFKYFVKSFGCRLAHFGYKIPSDLKELFFKDSFMTRLSISFTINDEYLLLYKKNPKKFSISGNGDLLGDPNIPEYIFFEFHNWLHICYKYNMPHDGNLGSKWIADNQFVYLGSHVGRSDPTTTYFGK